MKKFALCTALLFVASGVALAQHYTVLYSFAGGTSDGLSPEAAMIQDSAGNLYGTAAGGGAGGAGIVFELSPNGNGGWAEKILYAFCPGGGSCVDGDSPVSALSMDNAGNLYGVTLYGGTGGLERGSGGLAGVGDGTVFELSPPGNQGDPWTETVLYSFCSVINGNQCLDGEHPYSKPVFDAAGNLYGTTENGGSGSGNGTVFELSPSLNGWTEAVLYTFCAKPQGGACPNGEGPIAGVIFDKSGNLYGTTEFGGSTFRRGSGVVYKLAPGSRGWSETVLASFDPNITQGVNPNAALSFDPAGNLYSTLGGAAGNFRGGVFQLNPKTDALRTLGLKGGPGGAGPVGGVVVDAKRGRLFGNTLHGGSGGPINNGVVFQITPNGKETAIYNFCSQPNCTDGGAPEGGLVEDPAGNLYGTTFYGGTYGYGVVFEITP